MAKWQSPQRVAVERAQANYREYLEKTARIVAGGDRQFAFDLARALTAEYERLGREMREHG